MHVAWANPVATIRPVARIHPIRLTTWRTTSCVGNGRLGCSLRSFRNRDAPSRHLVQKSNPVAGEVAGDRVLLFPHGIVRGRCRNGGCNRCRRTDTQPCPLTWFEDAVSFQPIRNRAESSPCESSWSSRSSRERSPRGCIFDNRDPSRSWYRVLSRPTMFASDRASGDARRGRRGLWSSARSAMRYR